MKESFDKMLKGYLEFRNKYIHDESNILQALSRYGQKPKIMFVACCDSRVDPALILQCDPGDLFVVRNVANIVPPFEKDDAHHGTSAALEFAVCFLQVKHIIILGHSQCGGIDSYIQGENFKENDFISSWVSLIDVPEAHDHSTDECAKLALHKSYDNCLTFPWIKEKVAEKNVSIHRWFFDIKTGEIYYYDESIQAYHPLIPNNFQF